MKASGKTRITVSAHYSDGHFLLQDKVFLADTLLYSLHTSMFAIVELRIVVPAADAEALMRGMISGDTELMVQHMQPLTEGDN